MTSPPETTRYYTPKLSLLAPSVDDEISALRNNWERLDQVYSGAVVVNPGVVPDDSVLYDGCIVAERSTGIVWRAQRNSSGVFEKRFIKYPWRIQAAATGNWPNAAAGNFGVMGYDVLEGACVNCGSESLVNNRVVVPVTGIYQGSDKVNWSGNTTTGNRTSTLWVNDLTGGSSDTSWYENSMQPNNIFNAGTCTTSHFCRLLNKGDTLAAGVWQNSGASCPFFHWIQMALIRVIG